MQSLPKPEIAAQTPKARIVQHNRRRFSIRLEAIYWHQLERLARQSNRRLGQLVAELADGYAGNNLSSYLRVVSMLEAERALAQAALTAGGDSLLSVVRSCPCPGLVLSRTRTIIAYNDAFAEWLGADHPPLTGAEVTGLLQVRAGRSLNDVWNDLMEGRLAEAQANVLYLAPGRANAAQACFIALRPDGGQQAYAILWLLAKGGHAGTTRPARPAAVPSGNLR